ncbi:uncharacterized protein GGS22DRAFT_200300 [Annulohypoxylon maeteangense]|uniref:uncharacterized protein n=1 Tax=Annulohypoxylon maeteangense TaxID=1927788 RepID=UPI002007319D|nr:uncharacterized protein GGS22DRAFT_200300 [Annulohypoxylon maeteangense]KAI0885419.1 hypothetical protein GGS22DRAFT_200300 [Annulohypoxylon maeteangense]
MASTTPTHTLLTGKRLVSALDTMDYHHKLLEQIFTTEDDPTQVLREEFAELCETLRQTVSPEVEKLFIASPSNKNNLRYDYQTRCRVWDSIYRRIYAPIGNPFRFSHISSHRHVRLDDRVQNHLSEDLQKTLPLNMDPYGYNPLKKLQGGAPNRGPRPSTTTTAAAGNVIRGNYVHDDIIYSPTAQATTRARTPTSEVYQTLSLGELRRPIKISNSPRIPHGDRQPTEKPQNPKTSTKSKKSLSPKQPQTFKKPKSSTESPRTPKDKIIATYAGHVEGESSKSNPSISNTTDDSDWDDATVVCSHRYHCQLCRKYQRLNAIVDSIRIENASGATDGPNVKNTHFFAAQQVKDYQYILRMMERKTTVDNPTYDPADTRLWSSIAENITMMLETHERDEKQAALYLLNNFRRTTFVLVERGNVYDENNHGTLTQELPLSGDELDLSGPMLDPEQTVIDEATDEERDRFEISRLPLYYFLNSNILVQHHCPSPCPPRESRASKNQQEPELEHEHDSGFEDDDSFWLDPDDDDSSWMDSEDDDSSWMDSEDVNLTLFENY